MNYDAIAGKFSSPEREEHFHRKVMYSYVGHVIKKPLEDQLIMLPLFQSMLVADLGCGSGRFGQEILLGGADLVVGFDNSMEMLRIGIERAIPGLSFVKQDIFQEFNKQYHAMFAFVTAYNVVHYARNEDQLRVFFQNVASLLCSTVGKLKEAIQFVMVLVDPQSPVSKDYIPGMEARLEWVGPVMKDGSEICTTLYGVSGEELCRFSNYYWRQETLERLAKSAGLGNFHWNHPMKFGEIPLTIFSGGKVS